MMDILNVRQLGKCAHDSLQVYVARRLAVILHRIWVEGTDFRWTGQVAAP